MENSLSSLKRERKILQQSFQLLANRINFLRLKDVKTWKTIKDTKAMMKKAALVKVEQTKRKVIQQEIKAEKERALSEKRSSCKIYKEMQKTHQHHMKAEFFNNKLKEVFNLKNQKCFNQKNLRESIENRREKNHKRVASVLQNRVFGKNKIIEYNLKKYSAGREIYRQKVEVEESIKLEKIKELEAMERLERELIKKIKDIRAKESQLKGDLLLK